MTLPLNIDFKTGEVISSNLVIYQGPDIPCISLCKGDSVTKVINKLATKLCNLLESLDVSNYDLTCLELGSCPPETFEQLIQVMIDAICAARDTPGPAGTNGTNGNYVVTAYEPAGVNCANGGVRIQIYDGITNLAIDTKYVCNGNNGNNGLQGLPGAPGIGLKGDPGTDGSDGNPATITFDQTGNCEIEVTENTGNPDYNITLKLQDSGWLDLRGFTYYGVGIDKPQVRKIGNALHFKGIVVLPLSSDGGATLIPLVTYNSYDGQVFADIYTGAGGVNVNSAGSITMNKGVSVLPLTLDYCSKAIDDTYQKQYISSRQILVGSNNEGVSLSSVFQIIITTTGTMLIQTILDIEQSALGGTSFKGGSPLRFITSKVKSGDYVPDFTNAASQIHHNSATGTQPAEINYQPRTYPFDCDAGNPAEIGGFSFKLDGLTAFLT